MTSPDFNARVAELVMGWKPRGGGLFWQQNESRMRLIRDSVIHLKRIEMTLAEYDEYKFLFSPDTDPTADYSVLVKVRETWSKIKQAAFLVVLEDIMCQRTLGAALRLLAYEPGDYARAALAVVEGGEG